jgi:metal-responsive CopG/Arc/MetJ family transcriptional regulator
MPDRVSIKIPRPLYNRLQRVIDGSGFSSATDFIVFVLRDLVGSLEPEASSSDLSPDELVAIRKKLENLGYL